ncbi:hypothetical protein ACPVTF_04440 [Geobacillus icigianus]|uniref:hypothetical protein n=1 Tax=Geobacillus TaxID=129337 RepID=UPI00053A1502|nr:MULTISPECIES: hypothetical protein [Geobacillus]KYD28666.1 hypothetical protein B4113_3463 [Geobacillus sp. B4113_201601]
MDVQLLAGFLRQNTAGLSSLPTILSLLNQKSKDHLPPKTFMARNEKTKEEKNMFRKFLEGW